MSDVVYNLKQIESMLYPFLANTPIEKAILFGSYAKGNATPQSDIDLYIDSKGALNGFNFFGVYGEIEKILDKPIDLIEALDLDQDSPLAEAIKLGGITIYERK